MIKLLLFMLLVICIIIFILQKYNKEFIEKIHTHTDNWDSWNPITPFNIILKNAIDKTNI